MLRSMKFPCCSTDCLELSAKTLVFRWHQSWTIRLWTKDVFVCTGLLIRGAFEKVSLKDTSLMDLAPCGPGAIPPFFLLPHLLLYLLVSFTFPFSPFLLTLSIFLFFHPFPFYQDSSTLFPGRMSWEPTKPGFSFCVCWFCVVCIF